LRRNCNAAILRLVTLAEAWRELGVEPGADAETVRRAYLRLIKTRKPEVDPAGFQRARQAYEIARASGEIEALAAAAGAAAAASAGDHPGEAPVAGEAGAGAQAQPDGEAAGAASPGDAAFQGFVAAWNAVPPSADQRARLEIAREAVAVLATDPRAHWLLVTTLSRLGTDEALAEALRAGWANGWPEFLEALLVRLPARARREEVEAAFGSASPTLRLAGAAACAGWDGARGAALVAELCREATADFSDLGDAAGARVRALPVPRILDVILALHAAGALDAAAEAQAALGKCLHDSGLEIALAAGPLGGVFMLAEELAGLPRDFPQPLRAAFAGATRAGDLTSAFSDAAAYVERYGEGGVAGWAGRLKSSAPNVASILESATASDRARRAFQTRARLSSLRYLILPALLIGGRYCLFESPSPPPIPYEPARYMVPSPVGAVSPFTQTPQAAAPLDLEMVIAASDDLCGLDAPRNGQLVCADVEALVTALAAHECDEVPARLRALKRALGRSPSDLDTRFLTRAELARWQACTPHGTSGGGDARP
jgi:hypothetical protein